MIRKAAAADLPEILRIYAAARAYMKASGNPTQWGDHHPAQPLLEEDIRLGRLYVEEDGGLHGVFALLFGDDPTYAVIEGGSWLSDAPYATIHRIAADGQRPGFFPRALRYCLGLCGNLRIDTHADNRTMQHQIEKCHFVRCGIIYVEDGSPRIAYQYAAPEENGDFA